MGEDWFQGGRSESLLDNRQARGVSPHAPHGDASVYKDAVLTASQLLTAT